MNLTKVIKKLNWQLINQLQLVERERALVLKIPHWTDALYWRIRCNKTNGLNEVNIKYLNKINVSKVRIAPCTTDELDDAFKELTYNADTLNIILLSHWNARWEIFDLEYCKLRYYHINMLHIWDVDNQFLVWLTSSKFGFWKVMHVISLNHSQFSSVNNFIQLRNSFIKEYTYNTKYILCGWCTSIIFDDMLLWYFQQAVKPPGSESFWNSLT